MEVILFVFLGGAAGSWVAMVGVNILITLIPQEIPRLERISVNVPVLAFTIAICLASSLLFGMLMAIQSFNPRETDAIESSRTKYWRIQRSE
jgi:putative ABC transport system permease protein